MTSQLASLLALFSLLHVGASRTILIDWFIPQNQDSFYADRQAAPGDIAVFNFDPTGNSDVYIHPTGECERDGSILIAAKGSGTGNYTFDESQINTTIFFTSQAASHCRLGQFININVVEVVETMAPSDPPSMVASEAPSGATSAVPSEAPTTTPTLVVTDSPNAAPETSIFVLAAEKGTYSTLLGAANATGVLAQLEELKVLGPLTVFGPTDTAFASTSLVGVTEEQLIGILSGHVVQGNYTAGDFIAAGCIELQTLSGTSISVSAGEGGVVINGGAAVVDANILADDGVLHGIDAVIGEYVACPTPMPSSSFIPSDMPSLVPSDMPSIVPSAMATEEAEPTSSPVVAPESPPTPRGFDLGTSKASSVGMLAASVVTLVATMMV
ncbi:MAG: hypothetical protein SGBAC_008352 [Bacillariaceae sp.]